MGWFTLKFPSYLFVAYFIVSINGNGTEATPYAPDVPAGVGYSAYIPSRANGRPKNTSCIVVVRDRDADKLRQAGALEVTATADTAGKVFNPDFKKEWITVYE